MQGGRERERERERGPLPAGSLPSAVGGSCRRRRLCYDENTWLSLLLLFPLRNQGAARNTTPHNTPLLLHVTSGSHTWRGSHKRSGSLIRSAAHTWDGSQHRVDPTYICPRSGSYTGSGSHTHTHTHRLYPPHRAVSHME